MKTVRMNGIRYSFADNLDVNIDVDKNNNTTVMTAREQSVEWIMRTLYVGCELDINQRNMLQDQAKELVDKWEDILNER